MKTIGFKLLRIAVLLGGGLLVVRTAGTKLAAGMDRMFEAASDDFPPKWMYSNITAIRENTERIVEALAHEQTDADAAAA